MIVDLLPADELPDLLITLNDRVSVYLAPGFGLMVPSDAGDTRRNAAGFTGVIAPVLPDDA